MATWELRERLDVPWRVVIDEAIALTRKFGATEAHRFVNGVLDKVARDLRSAEIQGGR
jgi:N utilization substance protein B